MTVNSEDARSVDLGLHSENEDRGFYTENFHSASWVFRGDDVSPDNSPRCLSKRPRPVASKLSKAAGNKCHKTIYFGHSEVSRGATFWKICWTLSLKTGKRATQEDKSL